MKRTIIKFHTKNLALAVAYCLIFSLPSKAQFYHGAAAYYDTIYFSNVFGHEKIYRIYLPEGYQTSNKRYPAIYYFHGWGGRYNKDDNANLAYNKLKGVVDKYQAILVMVDGNIDTLEPRPYNVGYHEDVKFQVQMKDYFPELINHIDSTYRTISNREHRGIIGFSMGGFISFYLAGKYPDSVSAAVSFAGSPEFFVGYPDNHTLYPMRYSFSNLRQVNLAFRNGTKDILYYLNSEVHDGALWDEKVKMQYWTFDGPHMIDEKGETTVFEDAVKFVTNTFDSLAFIPETTPQNWSHYDLYNTFTVWNYTVKSNKNEPGLIFLRNVDKNGFGFYTKRWLPNGPPIIGFHANISTAPIYDAGKNYNLLDYNKAKNKIAVNAVQADEDGKINMHLNGDHEIGIFTSDDKPEFIFLNHTVSNRQDSAKSKYLKDIKNNRLRIQLLNRGGEIKTAAEMQVKITTADSSIKLKDSLIIVNVIAGQRVITLSPLTVACTKMPPLHAEPADVRFHVTIIVDSTENDDEFTVPVFFDVPEFDNIKVDDGVLMRDSIFGNGNGNGIMNAGESIMLYQDSNRLRLYTEDSFVINKEERLADEIIPARWPDGYTFSSVIKISPECPDGHEIQFLASYETKTYNPIERKVHWGKVKIKCGKIPGIVFLK